ncbi:hypothetical protein EVB91_140 [Rhizobium phage RHph_I1_18]|nr:hypothetical protein EVB91_140 [Rhizobium phage RHph_I1_18]
MSIYESFFSVFRAYKANREAKVNTDINVTPIQFSSDIENTLNKLHPSVRKAASLPVGEKIELKDIPIYIRNEEKLGKPYKGKMESLVRTQIYAFGRKTNMQFSCKFNYSKKSIEVTRIA